jgi:hypothetical protein
MALYEAEIQLFEAENFTIPIFVAILGGIFSAGCSAGIPDQHIL